MKIDKYYHMWGDKGCMHYDEIEPIGYCKDCKFFELDKTGKVDGMPLIVAHEVCMRWGNGCKTDQNGYCYLFETKGE